MSDSVGLGWDPGLCSPPHTCVTTCLVTTLQKTQIQYFCLNIDFWFKERGVQIRGKGQSCDGSPGAPYLWPCAQVDLCSVGPLSVSEVGIWLSHLLHQAGSSSRAHLWVPRVYDHTQHKARCQSMFAVLSPALLWTFPWEVPMPSVKVPN